MELGFSWRVESGSINSPPDKLWLTRTALPYHACLYLRSDLHRLAAINSPIMPTVDVKSDNSSGQSAAKK